MVRAWSQTVACDLERNDSYRYVELHPELVRMCTAYEEKETMISSMRTLYEEEEVVFLLILDVTRGL